MKHFICGVFLMQLFIGTCFAQSPGKVILSGQVIDQQTGERLTGTNVFLPPPRAGITANAYGFFSLSLPLEPVQLTISHIGYQTQRLNVQLTHDSTIVIRLVPITQEIQEVTVSSIGSTNTYSTPDMGRFVIPLDYVRRGPALLGENDLLKTIQLLPGVQAGTEGTVGLHVRGGSPDQNLILLDDIPVYNVNHLFGFFSVINTDAVAQADFLKGSMPARYGGRLSSVLDIRLKEGNLQRWKGNVGLSPIATRLMIEGPLKKNVSSLLISARRTWLDALSWAVNKLAGGQQFSGYGFYDLNLKWNYILSRQDRLFASFYTGQDRFSNRINIDKAAYSYRFDWGNQTGGLRWNHQFSKRVFSNITVYYTNFRYRLNEQYQADKYFVNGISSGIRDLGVKLDLDYYQGEQHSLRVGGSLINHVFSPEIKQFKANQADTSVAPSPPVSIQELALYAEDNWAITSSLKANLGFHYANQWVEGKTWSSLQPRLAFNYQLNPTSSVKASYNRMTQFVHLLTNSSVGLPTDLWVPVTSRIPPETAHTFATGYYKSLASSAWNGSVEFYYKTMNHVLEYKEGTSFLNNFSTPWFDRVAIGSSTSYGTEFFLERLVGKTRGWISYTLSKTDRVFEELNQGKAFPYKYDRRHNLALVINHAFTKDKSLSLNFIYSSGSVVTLSSSRYSGILLGDDLLTKGTTLPYDWANLSFFQNLPNLLSRNNYRTPAYHRMDVSYKTSKQKKHGTRSWIISCYNVYNHLNAFYLYYDQGQLKQFSLFPIVPSLTYQYGF